MDIPKPRELYDRLEKAATPKANALTRSDEFAQLAELLTTANDLVRRTAGDLQARLWHAVNLPALSDHQRMLTQLGALDRQVRLLTLELDRARAEAAKARGDDRRATPG